MDGPRQTGEGGAAQVIELDGDPDAPSRGRHAAERVLTAWGCEDPAREDLLLVVSELVTNAVLHGAEPIVVTLVRDFERVRVEVTDAAPDASPYSSRVAKESVAGRGLSVVTRLAAAWGWRADPGTRKTVWAELPLRSAI
ncbi:ATP-binding protein [Pseudonocardia sp.]|uniref:ATP-binding protein n=1 Tax=Pseudonocardia sp. TaxID=60912 RepID=UPI0031FD95FF